MAGGHRRLALVGVSSYPLQPDRRLVGWSPVGDQFRPTFGVEMSSNPRKPAARSASKSNAASGHRAHPLARWSWSILSGRSDADMSLVYASLRQRLDPGPSSGKAALAREALSRCQKGLALDHPPSRSQYDDFRAKQGEPGEWPSVTLIRNALGGGSWQAAIAQAQGQPLPDLTARRLISNGKIFPRSELEPILSHWAEQTKGPLRQTDFLAWCREEAGKSKPTFERLPLTPNTLERRFGSWAEALAAIGELDRCIAYWRKKMPQPDLKDGAKDAADERLDLSKLPSQTGGQYSRSAAVAWLKWARRQLHLAKGEPLTYRDYVGLRRRLIRQAHEQGRVVYMPATTTISSHLDSFRNAQIALGLVDAKHTCASRERYDEEKLVAAVVEAGGSRCRSLRRALSGELTQADYRAWRHEALSRSSRGDERAPSLKTLLVRLGGRRLRWAEVLRRVEQAHNRRQKGAGSRRRGDSSERRKT